MVRGKPIVKVPGCPPIGEVLAGTIVHLLAFERIPQLDLRFDPERFRGLLGRVNPRARITTLSAASGEGMEEWYGWLRERMREARAGAEAAP